VLSQQPVWFEDEMRFGLRTQLKRRWTPQGIRPAGSVNIAYEWGYLYVALNPSEGQLQAWLMPDMQQNTFQAFLDDFAATIPQQSLLLLDGAPAHRSQVKLPEQIKLQLLPAYAPELNPVERLFQELRKTISNQIFSSIQQLETVLIKALQTYFQLPEKLIQLTLFPWMIPDSNR
jgi:hypothetical protein